MVPSSGVKRTALFWVITQLVVVIYYHVSGPPNGPIFRGQENCTLLGNYTASSGNFLPRFGITYWLHLQGSRILTPEDGTLLM